MVRVCILFAAGTNCDRETVRAFELAGATVDTVHINRLKERPALLRDYAILALPGGFSYGDYLSSGRILANELLHHLRDEFLRFHDSGGLTLGICNGFQVLVRSGLLPALDRPFEPQSVTLEDNDSGRFEDRWCRLKVEDSPCVFTRGLEEFIELPVAHAEGRFVTRDGSVLKRMRDDGQVVLRYVDREGEPAEYPANPNGSVEGITGICDPSGRIFGLMPHPERFVTREHHPRWHRERGTTPSGIRIFTNAVEYARKNL
ncbi:MAG TPA: phosphoribosylformylglycinamidine synthase I [candidate division WOR-3 bacterium]|uniref:Phosphoribosylformylglycinamidine synthase subunit PurQ n=1 Tax=candidate division WOR-3 bacterium TaxID=2052148 RepID=A0A7V0T6L8_UNCW3|nr:phosphoribosylformylglycinamidine synthase I [candidate division WOR-3 bacterium]